MVYLNAKTNLTYTMSDDIKSFIGDTIKKQNIYGRPIKKSETVIIKVNIVGPFEPEKAACTHPEVVRMLVKELKEIGTKTIIVEDCFDLKAPIISGIQRMADEEQVEFINLKNHLYEEIKVRDYIYQYYREIIDADHLILVPKLKTHLLTNYTGTIKLMYGAITKKQRIAFHRNNDQNNFANILVDIFSIKLPTLAIMDGITSMDGAGPTQGYAKNTGLLLSSNDAVILDYYACTLMKYNPMEISMINSAFERNLVNCLPSEVVLFGDDLKSFNHDFILLPNYNGQSRERFIRLILGSPVLIEEKCAGCQECFYNCPFKAIQIVDNMPVIDPKKCTYCFCCTELCPHQALIIKKTAISRFNEINKCDNTKWSDKE